MQTVARNNFITVKTEGGILPADLLQRVADGTVEGLKPTDYHLAATDRLNEAINRSWLQLMGRWQTFQQKMAAMSPSESGVTVTREWMLALLQELGYGRLPYQGKLSVVNNDEEIVYPISHLYDHTPIHLLSFRQKLDRRDDALKRSPHSLIQEFLNRSDDHLWGVVSNGLRLRILRDNISLTRAAYVEFDLEAMFDGELYSDFTLLWLIVHQSRVETNAGAFRETPLQTDCWLEKWSQSAIEQGTRALDALRDGVQEAIAALGRGFLAHKGNAELCQQLQSGELSTGDYYRQLLRMVYRLLFLFAAEDRDLLLLPDTPAAIAKQYNDYYAIARLRRLADGRRGGPHPDLYRGLRLLFFQLRAGYAPLGLPALGGFLFSERATTALDAADIANLDLLNAIRALAFATEGKVRRPIDYKNMGAEELGSVYESLLELHPRLHVGAAEFTLDVAAGNERKTTGSYYTPTSLINSLLDSALEPVVADRLQNSPDREQALLNIKVVDPAAGSGHFLIAAARRLARHLAQVRTGDEEPGPEAVRHALRDVVGRCIYGVDINEMAVELCKVALWMETLDPGKPLSFLDANIQCGNSLMGATPALLAGGIPNDAFKPITGDDKAYCTEWKKQNKAQKKQGTLFSGDLQPWDRLDDFSAAMRQLTGGDDETLADVQAREAEYVRLMQGGDYKFGKLWADAWCAAFVWRKQPEGQGGWAYPVTEQVFRNLERSPYREPNWLKDEVQRLADEYQFFHWHLAFPQIFAPKENLADLIGDDVTGWTGGFDVVLGNPPWERIKLQEKEFFANWDEEIATARNAAARRKLIAQLPQTNPALHADFMAAKRNAEGLSAFVRNSGKYPLCGRGDVNTYTIFAELSRHVQSDTGRVGVIVPSGIATDNTTRFFFQDLMDMGTLVSLYAFENEAKLFPGVDHRVKFALLSITGMQKPVNETDFVFGVHKVVDLKENERHFSLSAEDIKLLNPNSRTCPIFRSHKDAEITKAIYRRAPVLVMEGQPDESSWDVSFLRMFDMTNDSNQFHTREQIEAEGWIKQGNIFKKNNKFLLPLYEAKMIWHFNHRFGTYDGALPEELARNKLPELQPSQLVDPYLHPIPNYWLPSESVNERTGKNLKWALGFRGITSATLLRTLVGTIIPLVAVGNSLPLLIFSNPDARLILCFQSNLCAFLQDYVLRQSIGGPNLNFFIAKQIPFITPEDYETNCLWSSSLPLISWISIRAFELVYTAYDLQPFAQDYGYHAPPFRWDEERRFLLRCELDAAYFHLYGIERDDVDYIMETFPIVKRKDEAAHGEYRTKRVILEIYDEMGASMQAASGKSYQTRLNPPPAHPDAAHPWDEAYLGVELPREQWWKEVAQAHEKVEEVAITSPSPVAICEPAPTLTLTSPPVAKRKGKKSKKSGFSEKADFLAAQPALVTDFTPPSGGYHQRLKRIMALKTPKNQRELMELIAALGDENETIRWLSRTTLTQTGGTAVVSLLAAYLQTKPTADAQAAALKVLSLIADTSEDEAVKAAAQQLL